MPSSQKENDEREKSKAFRFQGLFNSFFVLFQIMNGDQSILDPLFVNAPATKFIFVAFMIITNWSILSILTAVVSENMITVTPTLAPAVQLGSG